MGSNILVTFAVTALWMFSSVWLINLNKYVLNGPFPHPEMLVVFHMFSGSCFAAVLVLSKRDLFPSLDEVKADPWGTLKFILPIGVCFAIGLLMSNTAFQYLPVALLQMMKEGNIPIVYTLSLLIGLERFDRGQAAFTLLVFLGAITATSAAAVANVSILGILLQLSGQFAEVIRIILQASILRGEGCRKLDNMSMVLCMSPVCLICLTPVVAFRWSAQMVEQMSQCANLLSFSCAMAFALNCLSMVVLQRVSTVLYVFLSSAKAMIVVFAGSYVWHEPTTPLQNVGFAMEIVGITCYSLLKQRNKLYRGVEEKMVRFLPEKNILLETKPLISRGKDEAADV